MGAGNNFEQAFKQIEGLLEAMNEINSGQLPRDKKYASIIFFAREIVRVADATPTESDDEQY